MSNANTTILKEKGDYMAVKNADTTVVHRVELATGRLDSLSTLPCIAAQFLPRLLQPQFSPSVLFDIIESDPALCARTLSLMYQHGVSLSDEKFSFRRALDRLPAHLVRDAILSIKLSGTSDLDQRAISPPQKNLIFHSLAVACCAKDVAEIISPLIEPQLAYLAGLLHDIGKIALKEAMPKSFAIIAEEAKSTQAGSRIVEQKHLGADHTILGKNLAQKWHLPEAITLAIWLHHSDTVTISRSMPEAKIAQIVQLADSLARQCNIGQSGSFDSPEPIAEIAKSLAIDPEQLAQIRRRLPETVKEKSKILGLDLPNATEHYCDIAHSTTAQFAQKNTELSLENQRLQTTSSHLDFATDFLLSINSSTNAIDIAENFATRWQRFYQTGKVCLYLVPPDNSQFLEAVVVESLSQSKIAFLNVPEGSTATPKAISNGFAILDAQDYADWLFEQLESDFDPYRTKLMPLLSNGKVMGVIIFELHYPADIELFKEKFKMTTSIAGAVLDMAFARQKQGRFAEQFAQLITKPPNTKPHTDSESPLDALAEMAAGVAHELNNPLSVISGRAQLLAKAETDSEKKQSLSQIQENAHEVSVIIDELMSFAEPQKPRSAQTDIRQILNEALQLASQKTNTENLNVQIEVADETKNVFVDSAQIASAIANVICNSFESYTNEMGLIKIAAEPDETGGLVKIMISDLGCGMDAETLQKATQPFFSAKPAGRKRGMGLAYAARLVQINKGSLEITSEPGKGTTVTIHLPRN